MIKLINEDYWQDVEDIILKPIGRIEIVSNFTGEIVNEITPFGNSKIFKQSTLKFYLDRIKKNYFVYRIERGKYKNDMDKLSVYVDTIS